MRYSPFQEVPEQKLKQIIDAQQLYSSYRSAFEDAKKYQGRLHWEKSGGTEYLINTRHDHGIRQRKSLGSRSGKTEEIARIYTEHADDARQRLDALTEEIKKQVRMNRALRLGNVPPPVIKVLAQIENAGLSKKIITIGTNALYAYAAAASVTFADSIMATQDLDLLWDSRSKLRIASPDPKGLLGIIQRSDASFTKMVDKPFTLTNNQGYQVDLVKRDEGYQDSEPGQVWENADHFWAEKVHNMDWLLSAPKFEQVIISASGEMATMTTVDPRAFGLFKLWLSERKERDAGKRRRDYAQATAVFQLVEECLPHLSFEDIKTIPERIRARARNL
ncbi:Nucleotidyltransferase [Bordetella sputigena]|uniref:GSU2403 family nucleotidyltransferase fold protein n=1 Tax=Bordetella sputigena TaxID=1416810 RepID=UPI0039F051E7